MERTPFSAGAATTFIFGNMGDDLLEARAGLANDTLEGGEGRGRAASGGNGDDFCSSGGEGDDSMTGNARRRTRHSYAF